ncbi:arsinothricin resistance N-acetyltransferase ArsN1 family B [Solimicrobium silvestre]|uniref:Sortase and related acyltransferase n=1 Tax=Solimicrobium silvestre TaxID=2099400 RepID=A0A2S9GZA2_9BURK|nr:arsinothricin resistance N-acetyltransferase ArsN1 family B [Solimicrobium silvestre]PRC92956.1 Sortase and related acyltransferase [Solimicrobium silvestre]
MSPNASDILVRSVTIADAGALCVIYNHYVLHSTISFEEEPISEDEMAQRIVGVTVSFPWLVAELNGRILGYAYASKWRVRHAYRFAVESSIYLGSDVAAKGIGSLLYLELINALKEQNVHTVIAGIALPNLASISLHKKFGFEPVAQFKEVGFKKNAWIDVMYWQLLLK